MEDIESIDWAEPDIQGASVLPAGYAFVVKEITYRQGECSYAVTVQVDRQYLGDVTGYQAQVASLQAEISELETQLAAADELAISLYEAQLTATGDTEEAVGTSGSAATAETTVAPGTEEVTA